MFRNVVRSHYGELTETTRTMGDSVRFRIYHSRLGVDRPPRLPGHRPFIPQPTDIVIVDELDARLTDVRVFDGGHYHRDRHTITWVVSGRRSERRAYVEFEATVGREGTVTNRASAKQIGPRRHVVHDLGHTNDVEITVLRQPRTRWIPFRPDARPGEPVRTHVKDETTMGATVRFDIPGVFIHAENVDGVLYHHVSIPGWAALTEVGKPELPIVGGLLEVPFDVDVTPEVTKAETVVLDGYHVWPAQEPAIDRDSAATGFVADRTTYLTSADYPAEPAAVSDGDVGVIRGHRVAFVKAHPVRYNPVTRRMTAHTTLEVRLNFNTPGQVEGVDRRIESAAFEQLLEVALLNYKSPIRFARPPLEVDVKQGCDYLIIAHGDFYDPDDATNAIVRLADWKRRKGYTVAVTDVGSIPNGGNTDAAIRAYIEGAYHNWYPVPSYVLLVGDSDHVVPRSGSDHPGSTTNGPQPQILTDQGYVTVDGTDDFPDMFIGRLSVEDAAQLDDVVDKILAYEQNPPDGAAHPSFYGEVTLAGEFADGNGNAADIDGREGRPWIANLESIREFLAGEGYAVERLYRTDSGFPASANADTPTKFHDGTDLPADLLSPTYGWNAGAAEIVDAFDDGRLLVAYRGHGSAWGWGNPSFRTWNAAGMQPNDLTPLMLSITCQTGWFDNEVDDDTEGGHAAGTDAFAEHLIRQAGSGPVAALAMTRNSYTGWNDFLVFGAIRALWPTFEPDPAWADHPTATMPAGVRLLRAGQILNFMKLYMAQAYGANKWRRAELEMCHLIGDPEMPIWTAVPGELEVVHPDGIGSIGNQQFIVNVADRVGGAVANATVALTRAGSLVQWAQTGLDGVARIALGSMGGGNLDVTVTALGYRPYSGTIVVVAGGAAFNKLDPPDGPEGQSIELGGHGFGGGEMIDVWLDDEPAITVEADADGKFGQNPDVVWWEVPVGHPHGPANVLAHGQSSGRWATGVFHVRDANPIDLWTYSQFDSSTWSLNAGDNPTWNSPDIQLYDSAGQPVASNALVVGKQYTVKLNVRNATGFGAQNARVGFRWRNWGAGGPWEALDPELGVAVDVPANPPGLAIAEADFSPHVTGHLCLRASIEHVEDPNPVNNEGQENLHVGTSTSPSEICFVIQNETREPAPVHLEVRQLRMPGEHDEPLWGTWVRHPEPQILQPGERSEACVIIDPDVADVRPGSQAEFAVTAFVEGEIMGGVNIILAKTTKRRSA